jgi:sortase A
LGIWCFSYFSREIFQAWDSWQFDHRTRTSAVAGETSISSSATSPGAGVEGSSRPESVTSQRVAPGSLLPGGLLPGDAPRKNWTPGTGFAKTMRDEEILGRISIPRLRLTAMVREGVDDWTLNRAVGHIPSTPVPGEAGNVAVAGHRDTFFRGLKDLSVHDTIEFSTSHGDYEYQVESLRIVEPDNVGVLAPDSENSLTIVTCYPFHYIGKAPKRFIARARQIGKQVASR